MQSRLSQDRMQQISTQMVQAGAIGFLKGILVAGVTGAAISYQYNHGHNKRFFLRPYKTWYFVVCGIVGISFAVETAKINITKELAEEENLLRNQFFARELGGRN